MVKVSKFVLALTILCAGCAPGIARPGPQAADSAGGGVSGPSPSAPGYADIADLVLAAPMILDLSIRSATRIKGAESAGVAAGTQRFYVEADVLALIRGPSGVPVRVGYVVDVPLDAAGRAPKLKRRRVLSFARPVEGRPDKVQLTASEAQRDWSPRLDALTRSIAAEVVAANAAPEITGIGDAFYVAGSIPGEGETQIFLTTRDGRPVSLSVVSRPGQARNWSVALGEIVDQAAQTPARDTLLWYRLACGLPLALTEGDVADLETAAADGARADYRFVIESLGPCRPSR